MLYTINNQYYLVKIYKVLVYTSTPILYIAQYIRIINFLSTHRNEQLTEFRTDQLHLTITYALLELESLNPIKLLRMLPSKNKQTTELPTRSESKAFERG